MKKRVYNFNLPDDLRDYLKKMANKNHTTISGYLIKLIEQDKQDLGELFTIKESVSIEGDILRSIVNRIFLEEIVFENYTDIEKVKNVISERLDKFIKLDYKLDFEDKNGCLHGKLFFKNTNETEFKVLNIDVFPTAKTLSQDFK